MWTKKRHAASAETRALFAKLRSRGWRSDAEREDLVKKLAALPNLEPDDVGWMAVEPDAALRQAGLTLLRRFPFEAAAEPLFPFLGTRAEGVRRAAMEALEALAGTTFPERMLKYLDHPDPAVVHAALDYARHNPSDRYLPGIQRTLASPSRSIRRKAFAILEASASPRVRELALQALEDDDEDLRYRAVQLLARHPDPAHVGPLLAHCRNDSTRVQDAAIATLTPLLARSDAGQDWTAQVLPLLSDGNPKVRQLAARLLKSQQPARVVEAFLQAFREIYGPARDRALEALRELGPEYIRAFLDRDQDPDPAVASLAASVAVTIRSPEVVPHCIAILEGGDWWLRDRAALALAEIRDERALPALRKMLDDPESNLSAAAALGNWGTRAALPVLLEAYKKGTKDLRLEILDAFSKISDPRVPALFESILKADPDPLVKGKAARLLAALGSAEGSIVTAAPAAGGFLPFDFGRDPDLPDLLRHARAVGASDLHLAVGTVPHLRTTGRLQPLPASSTTAGQMRGWMDSILGEERRGLLEERKQLDFCHKDPELGRFRTNVFYQRKGLNAVFRLIPREVPTLSDVGLPESAWELTTYSQGLVLVTGPAGCGKTTTLAAMLDRINETHRSHILTVEDPIEYVHESKESLVNQREVPAHTVSFAKALRQALREDPDVILVGEMRDLETISLAITASETGHLVLATLHTTTASSTVDRIINSFPPDQQGQIRMMISDSLKAVLSQTLLPRRDGTGRVAAFEILRNTQAVAGLIREGKTFQIPTAIQTSAASGMVMMDGAMLQLVQDGTADPRAAYDRAIRKEPFEPFLGVEEGAVA